MRSIAPRAAFSFFRVYDNYFASQTCKKEQLALLLLSIFGCPKPYTRPLSSSSLSISIISMFRLVFWVVVLIVGRSERNQ